MSGYLIRSIETYRFSDETTATQFVEELKRNPNFELQKSAFTKKERKAKGEVIDEWVQVQVTKVFNDEKEPATIIEISYEVE